MTTATSKLCECGECGLPVPIAKKSDARYGNVKGQPARFVPGHGRRVRYAPLAERFWKKVDKNGPMPSAEAIAVHPEIEGERCWFYGSWLTHPSVRLGDSAQRSAHVVSFWLEHGRWPEPWCLHKCDRPMCVRPSHLFEGGPLANVGDMIAKSRDRWVRGRNINAKLTDEQVSEIRRLGQPWVRSGQGRRYRGMAVLLRRIAKRFGVSVSTIKAILGNKNWKDAA